MPCISPGRPLGQSFSSPSHCLSYRRRKDKAECWWLASEDSNSHQFKPQVLWVKDICWQGRRFALVSTRHCHNMPRDQNQVSTCFDSLQVQESFASLGRDIHVHFALCPLKLEARGHTCSGPQRWPCGSLVTLWLLVSACFSCNGCNLETLHQRHTSCGMGSRSRWQVLLAICLYVY